MTNKDNVLEKKFKYILDNAFDWDFYDSSGIYDNEQKLIDLIETYKNDYWFKVDVVELWEDFYGELSEEEYERKNTTMKIKKEFINIILEGRKKYEFRNSSDKGGLYLIEGKYYILKYEKCISHKNFDKLLNVLLNYADLESYMWVSGNKDYFYNKEKQEYKIHIYSWNAYYLKKVEQV